MEEQLAAVLAEMTRLKLRVDNAEIAWREESAWANKAESRANNKAESLAKKEKSRANKEEALRKTAKITYLRVLASNILHLHNLTNSLAHLKTKYQPTKIIEVPFCLDNNLPSNFWASAKFCVGVHHHVHQGKCDFQGTIQARRATKVGGI
jgi:hypothetical protein